MPKNAPLVDLWTINRLLDRTLGHTRGLIGPLPNARDKVIDGRQNRDMLRISSDNWDHAALRSIRALGGVFDVTITRAGEELRVEIIHEGRVLKVKLLESGKSIDVEL